MTSFPPPKKAGPKFPLSAEGVPIKAAPKARPPPPLMLYGAFKAGVKPEDHQVTCQVCLSHGKRTEVYLGRLPWQTRCVRCKSSWRAEDLHAYHEIVLGMAPSLPWRYHLRHGAKLAMALSPKALFPAECSSSGSHRLSLPLLEGFLRLQLRRLMRRILRWIPGMSWLRPGRIT